MSNMTHSVEVGGMRLKLRSTHDEAVLSEIVAQVNKVISDTRADRDMPFQKVLLLSLLKMAEELFLMRREATGQLGEVEDQLHQLIDQIPADRSPSHTQLDAGA